MLLRLRMTLIYTNCTATVSIAMACYFTTNLKVKKLINVD